MKPRTLILCLAALSVCSFALEAQVTTQIHSFRLSGPFAVPEGATLSDIRTATMPSSPWSGALVPSLQDSPSAGVLTFHVTPEAYARGTISVKGPSETKIWVDGHAVEGAVNLNPYQHEVKILYLAPARCTEVLQVCFEASAAIAEAPAAGRDITIYDILNGTRVDGVALSPSGKYAVLHFTTTEGADTRRYSELREVATGRRITRLEGRGAEWMPVSDALLVSDEGSLYRMDPESLERTLLVKDMPEGQFTMSPTEDYLILHTVRPGPQEEDSGVFEIIEPDDRQPHWRDRVTPSKLDIATGVSTSLSQSPFNTYVSDISQDGTKLLLESSRSRLSKRPTTVSDIMIMDAVTLQTDTIMHDAEFLETMCFSPDGKKLLVRASPESFDRIGEHIAPGQTSSMIFQVLYLYDIATGKVTPLTDRIPQSVGNFVWNRTDGQIYFSAEDRDRIGLFTVDPKSPGKVRPIDVREEVVTGFSCEAGTIAYVGEGASNSMRCWARDLRGKSSDILMEDSSAAILDGITLGEVHDWNYVNSRGETIYGRYYLPPHFDPARKYPMIVNYYGGCSPTSRNFESRYPHPVYAAMDYVVYIVQPSGATGFGQEFAARHVNTWGEYGADDIIEGVRQFCKEHPFVREDRVGCIGASFGGFMSQYLTTVTDIFACAISHAGISDITSYWGEGYWGYSYCEVSTAGKYPWNATDMIISQSPLFNADKVNTPLLFLHGMADTNVPVGESIQMFTALKLLGKETAFVAVRDQDHHILQYDKRLRWQETIFAWFAKYLKDDPSWWEALYPHKEL